MMTANHLEDLLAQSCRRWERFRHILQLKCYKKSQMNISLLSAKVRRENRLPGERSLAGTIARVDDDGAGGGACVVGDGADEGVLADDGGVCSVSGGADGGVLAEEDGANEDACADDDGADGEAQWLEDPRVRSLRVVTFAPDLRFLPAIISANDGAP
jgi:hypothetical protein